MEKPWKSYLPTACAALGILLLGGTSFVCAGLERGAPANRVWVAAAMAAMALLGLLLLRLEGCGGDTLLAMLLPLGSAMLVRALCLDCVTDDFLDFLSPWYAYFKANGGFAAMAGSVGDYNVPYLYFIAAASYLNVPDLYLYKLFSILWDVALAWGCFRLVRSLGGERQGSAAPLTAFAAALLLPTVVVNGAYWAQCDVIYGALAIHAAALALEGRGTPSVALMALAFSFKLQAIFVLPLWGVLWLAKRVRFRDLWAFPLAYLAVVLPAAAMGKPLKDIFGVYFHQLGEYPRLVLNAPTIYQFIPYGAEVDQNAASALGIAAAGALVLALLALGWRLRGRMSRDTAMAAAVVLCIGVPFLLPRMHERYFFLADVFTLCWACAGPRPRRVSPAVLAEGASLASYCVFLRLKYNCVLRLGGLTFVMGLETLAMLAALAFALRELAGAVKTDLRRRPV